jgi:hypothetical protein
LSVGSGPRTTIAVSLIDFEEDANEVEDAKAAADNEKPTENNLFRSMISKVLIKQVSDTNQVK